MFKSIYYNPPPLTLKSYYEKNYYEKKKNYYEIAELFHKHKIDTQSLLCLK